VNGSFWRRGALVLLMMPLCLPRPAFRHSSGPSSAGPAKWLAGARVDSSPPASQGPGRLDRWATFRIGEIARLHSARDPPWPGLLPSGGVIFWSLEPSDVKNSRGKRPCAGPGPVFRDRFRPFLPGPPPAPSIPSYGLKQDPRFKHRPWCFPLPAAIANRRAWIFSLYWWMDLPRPIVLGGRVIPAPGGALTPAASALFFLASFSSYPRPASSPAFSPPTFNHKPPIGRWRWKIGRQPTHGRVPSSQLTRT